ncbi:MAG: DUF4337 domain-containing protein [Deltaproteobacteria bacterium]|nr:DUF4337 domain-containing protein [Deltaproteobacteria bacterium]
MPEKKQDTIGANWTSWVALSTAALAVAAALTTLYMGKFSSRTVLSQMQESDQWAYYQAKSIKGHAYELQREKLELELTMYKAKGALPSEVKNAYDKTIGAYVETVKRYDAERKEIKEKAEALSKVKEDSQLRAGKFAYGLILLQIAIMLSSIASITKKPLLWYFGLGLGVVGVFFFIDGFYIFY